MCSFILPSAIKLNYMKKLHSCSKLFTICIRDDIPNVHENFHIIFRSSYKLKCKLFFAFKSNICSHKSPIWNLILSFFFVPGKNKSINDYMHNWTSYIICIFCAIKVGFFVTSKNLPDGCLSYFYEKCYHA